MVDPGGTARARRRSVAEVSLIQPEEVRDGDPGDPGDVVARHHHRQGAPQRARDLPVAEHVLQRFRPAQAERVHAIAIPPGPHGERRGEAAASSTGSSSDPSPRRRRRGPRKALQLPGTEAAGAGHRQRGRLRRRRVVSARKAHEAVLGDRAHAGAKLGGAAPPRAASRSISPSGRRPAGAGRPRRARPGAAGPAAAAPAARPPAAPRRRPADAPRTEALEGLVDGPLHDLLLVPQLRRGCDHVLRPRPDGSRAAPGGRRGAGGCARWRDPGWTRPRARRGRPAGNTRACRRVPRSSSGRTTRSRQRRHAEQRPATRRGHQPVEDGLGLVAAGVPGRHQVEPRAGAHRLGRGVARSSRPGLEVPASDRRARARRGAVRRGRAHSSAQNCSSCAAPRPQPVVDVQRLDAVRAQRARERVHEADRVGAAGDQREHPRRRATAPRMPLQRPRHPLDRVVGHISYLTPVATRDDPRAGVDWTINAQSPRHRQPASPCLFAVRRRCAPDRPARARRGGRGAKRCRSTTQAEAVPGELIVGFTSSATAWQEQRAVEKARRRGGRPDRVRGRRARDGRSQQDRGRQRAVAAQPGGRVRRAQLRPARQPDPQRPQLRRPVGPAQPRPLRRQGRRRHLRHRGMGRDDRPPTRSSRSWTRASPTRTPTWSAMPGGTPAIRPTGMDDDGDGFGDNVFGADFYRQRLQP